MPCGFDGEPTFGAEMDDTCRAIRVARARTACPCRCARDRARRDGCGSGDAVALSLHPPLSVRLWRDPEGVSSSLLSRASPSDAAPRAPSRRCRRGAWLRGAENVLEDDAERNGRFSPHGSFALGFAGLGRLISAEEAVDIACDGSEDEEPDEDEAHALEGNEELHARSLAPS